MTKKLILIAFIFGFVVVIVASCTLGIIGEQNVRDRIYKQGYAAGKLGLPALANPHGYAYSEVWLDGYMEGLQSRPKIQEPEILDVMKMLKP